MRAKTIFWRIKKLGLTEAIAVATLVSLMALVGLAPAPGLAQTCSSRGTPTVPAPQVTYLRSLAVTATPQALATDASGRLFVADAKAGVVEVRDRYGRLEARWSGLQQPVAVAADDEGRVFVAEAEPGAVRIFDLAGIRPVSYLGRGEGEFALPTAISVAPQAKLVFVADGGEHAVKVYSPTGGWIKTIGGPGTTAGRFFFPAGLAVNTRNELLVVDQGNARVQVFDLDGNFLRCFGRAGGMGTSRLLVRANGLVADTLDRVFLVDSFQDLVRVFDPVGPTLSTVGTFGEGPGQLFTPVGLALDPFNRLFVASPNTGKVEVFGLDSFQDPHVVAAQVSADPDTGPVSRRLLTVWLAITPLERDARDLDPATLRLSGTAPIVLNSKLEANAQGLWTLRVLVQFAPKPQDVLGSELRIPVSLEFRDGVPVEGTLILKQGPGGKQ